LDRDATLKQAEKLLRQGKLDGAIAEYVRLVQDHPRDWTSVNALGDLYVRAGDRDRAVAQFTQVADFMFAEGFIPKAAALYKKALKVKADDEHTLLRLAETASRQGLLVDARNYLRQLEDRRRERGEGGAIANPDLLLALGRLELDAGREPEARLAFTRMMASARDGGAALLDLAADLARGGSLASAFLCTEVVVDDALLAGDWDRALDALRPLAQQGSYVPALVKLVELAVDAGRDDALEDAQARLADAYIEAGRAEEARVIAEDLVARNPQSEAHAPRLRRALSVLGVDEAEADDIIGRYREPEDLTDALTVDEPVRAASRESGAADGADEEDEAIVLDTIEIDLSDALAGLGAPPTSALVPTGSPAVARAVDEAQDLDTVFEQMRARAAQHPGGDGSQEFERALQRLERGLVTEAVADLRAAARAPLYRFRAAARLGRLLIARGEIVEGIEWLERAAEAPAPDADEGWSLLYDLADALQRIDENARALAVFLEIEADAGVYRDVRQRSEALARVQAGKA
jgi:tetratricopeptide (TPR) repeat protein